MALLPVEAADENPKHRIGGGIARSVAVAVFVSGLVACVLLVNPFESGDGDTQEPGEYGGRFLQALIDGKETSTKSLVGVCTCPLAYPYCNARDKWCYTSAGDKTNQCGGNCYDPPSRCEHDYGGRCGWINGTDVSCRSGNCCSANGWCGVSYHHCVRKQLDYSDNVNEGCTACVDDANRRRSGKTCKFYTGPANSSYCSYAVTSRRRQYGAEAAETCRLSCGVCSAKDKWTKEHCMMKVAEDKTVCLKEKYYKNCRKTCLAVEKAVEQCVCKGGSEVGNTCTKYNNKGKREWCYVKEGCHSAYTGEFGEWSNKPCIRKTDVQKVILAERAADKRKWNHGSQLGMCNTHKGNLRLKKSNTSENYTQRACSVFCKVFDFFAVETDGDCGCYGVNPCKDRPEGHDSAFQQSWKQPVNHEMY